MPLADATALMFREERRVTQVLLHWHREIAKVIQIVTRALRNGGRLFYLGAGTSGRLGVLDASECPPTFRADPAMVQAIIAGGPKALQTSVEGAEDDADAGAHSVAKRKVSAQDVVIGIAASGTTPFVWGGLEEAKRRKAKTVLLCFNPHLVIPVQLRPTVVLNPDLGPEVLTGSTRLKAGTATKLVLNAITTLTMVQLGKVVGNLMVDLRPTNAKLRVRAIRILCQLLDIDTRSAALALEESKWVIKEAVAQLSRRGRSPRA